MTRTRDPFCLWLEPGQSPLPITNNLCMSSSHIQPPCVQRDGVCNGPVSCWCFVADKYGRTNGTLNHFECPSSATEITPIEYSYWNGNTSLRNSVWTNQCVILTSPSQCGYTLHTAPSPAQWCSSKWKHPIFLIKHPHGFPHLKKGNF